MRADFHSEDPKLIWQNQPTEESKVSSIIIRQKARDLHAKTRRQMLGTLTVPLVVAFFYALSIKQFLDLRYALHLLFAFALAWSIAGLYFLNRESRSGALPADVGFSTGLEFCRREIERRLNYFRHDLLWSFGPVLLAIGTFVVAIGEVTGAAIFSKAAPLLALVVLWIAAYLFIRARQQRELRRELNDLSEIERENVR